MSPLAPSEPAHHPPPDQAQSHRRVAEAAVLSVAIFTVYLLFPIRNHYWDGVGFALQIEAAADPGDPALLHPNHLVYTLAGRLAYGAVRTVFPEVRALAVLQYLNMALAAANIDENGLTWGNALEFAAGAAPFAGKAIGGFFGVLGEMRGARAMKGAPGPYAVGAFSIFDWSGYPARVRRPQGPFVLLEGAAYDAARTAANKAVAAYRRANPQCADKFVHHIHPVKFGGDPTNPANFAIVDKATHDALNSFWARHQRDATPH